MVVHLETSNCHNYSTKAKIKTFMTIVLLPMHGIRKKFKPQGTFRIRNKYIIQRLDKSAKRMLTIISDISRCHGSLNHTSAIRDFIMYVLGTKMSITTVRYLSEDCHEPCFCSFFFFFFFFFFRLGWESGEVSC